MPTGNELITYDMAKYLREKLEETMAESADEVRGQISELTDIIGIAVPAAKPIEDFSSWETGNISSYDTTTKEPNINSNNYCQHIKIENISRFDVIRTTQLYVEPSGQLSMFFVCAVDADNKVKAIINRSAYQQSNAWYTVKSDCCEIDVSALLTAYPTVDSLYFCRMNSVSDYSWVCIDNGEETGMKADIADIEERAAELEEDVTELESRIETPEMVVPSKAIAVVGHEFNIYWKNIVRTSDIDSYELYASVSPAISGFKNYGNFLRFTPTSDALGTHTLTFRIRDKKKTATIVQKTMEIVVIADTAVTNKKVLFIGDSLTDAGIYPAEIQHNLSGGGIVSIGTRSDTVTIDGTQLTVHHEGRSGWAAYDYTRSVPNYKTDVPNAFWDGSKFNFSWYMSQNGYTGVDVVCINLGTNGVSNANTVPALEEMVASVHEYDANIIVLVSLITPSASQAGWGYYAGSSTKAQFESAAFDLRTACMDKFMDKANVDISAPYLFLDTENDFGTTEMAVSARNPKQITVQTNNVHPSVYGYLHIADAYYNRILYHLTKEV
jgi:hypothetical protein